MSELWASIVAGSPSLQEILAKAKGATSGLALLYVRATTRGATDADREAFDRAMTTAINEGIDSSALPSGYIAELMARIDAAGKEPLDRTGGIGIYSPSRYMISQLLDAARRSYEEAMDSVKKPDQAE